MKNTFNLLMANLLGSAAKVGDAIAARLPWTSATAVQDKTGVLSTPAFKDEQVEEAAPKMWKRFTSLLLSPQVAAHPNRYAVLGMRRSADDLQDAAVQIVETEQGTFVIIPAYPIQGVETTVYSDGKTTEVSAQFHVTKRAWLDDGDVTRDTITLDYSGMGMCMIFDLGFPVSDDAYRLALSQGGHVAPVVIVPLDKFGKFGERAQLAFVYGHYYRKESQELRLPRLRGKLSDTNRWVRPEGMFFYDLEARAFKDTKIDSSYWLVINTQEDRYESVEMHAGELTKEERGA